MNRFEGKVAIITGGSAGIGLATAQRFVSEGAYVYITGRRQSELDAAVRVIGKSVTGVQGDVSQLGDLDRLYATVEQQHGHVDILFANAGVEGMVPLGDITEAFFDTIFSINVKGLLFSVQKGLPLLRADTYTQIKTFEREEHESAKGKGQWISVNQKTWRNGQ